MEIRPWGTRGSIPSPGPSTVRYGGNTSCVEVRAQDGSLIIVDAGSGIRPLGSAVGPCTATILLTHYHWDHIQGLPFFFPAFLPQSDLFIYGPEFNGEDPGAVLAGQMYTPYFPAAPSQLVGIKGFAVTPERSFMVGSTTITSTIVSHPGTTFGYRIEDAGQVFVYMSDDEVDGASPEVYRNIVELARGADLLLHDCQYTEAEYASRHGWGHSTPRQVLRVAREAGVSRLMLFHHDPSHADEQVEALAEEARAMADGIEIIIGREGETIQLTAPVAEHGKSA